MTHHDLTDATPADAEHSGAKIYLRPRTLYGAAIELANGDTFDVDSYFSTTAAAVASACDRIDRLTEGRP